jgi:L-ribulokinase
MAVVAGVDFGTLSVRVSIVDSERGLFASAIAEYPLHRKREDPEYATQSHQDHMRALAAATREAVRKSGIPADQILALALDTTGSSVIPVGKNLQPLDDYYLWCDHRAKTEAAEITAAAHREKLAAIEWCGGVYSSEWGFSKLLHWLRHNPAKRPEFVSAFEHCDMVAATLCGITQAKQVKRSVCAMGHKWMWNASLGGLPPEDFLVLVGNVVSMGSAIFAFQGTGVFKSVEEAQDKICPQYKVFQPQVSTKDVYDKLYALYGKIYLAFVRPQTADFGNLLPGLIELSESARADAAH